MDWMNELGLGHVLEQGLVLELELGPSSFESSLELLYPVFVIQHYDDGFRQLLF